MHEKNEGALWACQSKCLIVLVWVQHGCASLQSQPLKSQKQEDWNFEVNPGNLWGTLINKMQTEGL
jgi:hypothetical protein